jgi:hypothetical protein
MWSDFGCPKTRSYGSTGLCRGPEAAVSPCGKRLEQRSIFGDLHDVRRSAHFSLSPFNVGKVWKNDQWICLVFKKATREKGSAFFFSYLAEQTGSRTRHEMAARNGGT